MGRYQIIYTKSQPLITWASTEAAAREKAAILERYGYSCSIWLVRDGGSVELNHNKDA